MGRGGFLGGQFDVVFFLGVLVFFCFWRGDFFFFFGGVVFFWFFFLFCCFFRIWV